MEKTPPVYKDQLVASTAIETGLEARAALRALTSPALTSVKPLRE